MRKPAAGDRTQRTTSLPHGCGGGVLVNWSLWWQRFTVPQLLAQARFAKEWQELPRSQAGISEQNASQTLLVSSCGLLRSALPLSSEASPAAPQSPAQVAHLLPLTHSVLQTRSPRGLPVRHSLLPRRQAQILCYPTTDSAPGRRALARRQRRT